MARIFDVIAGSEPGTKTSHSFGAYRTRAEAEMQLAAIRDRYHEGTWHDLRVEQIDVTGLFEIPVQPKPRDRFSVDVDVTESITTAGRDLPRAVRVTVRDGERIVGSYDRNYSMLRTFEPFRQGTRHFALVSPNYTATSVMDLATGKLVAGEEPSAGGFCPVGFYVPDW